jgi:hypothetical protein
MSRTEYLKEFCQGFGVSNLKRAKLAGNFVGDEKPGAKSALGVNKAEKKEEDEGGRERGRVTVRVTCG